MFNEFKIAARSLARSPAHTLVVVLTLGLGLGTATALFTSFMPALFPTRGYAQPDQLMRISLGQKGHGWESPLLAAHYGAYRNAESFRAVAATQSEMMNVMVDGEPRGVYGVAVSAEYFSVLGTGVAQGRGFLPEETKEGADTVAVVEWRFARGMSADGNVLGREIVINRRARRIVGVLPKNWQPIINLPNGAVYVPLVFPDPVKSPYFWVQAVARLRDGVTAAQAEDELRRREVPPIAGQLSWLKDYEVKVTPAFELGGMEGMRRYRSMIWVGVAAIGCLHLLACVNAGSLLLIRAVGRRRDVGIRLALGGSRWRVLRPFLAEGALMTVAAAGLGWVVARWVVPPLLTWMIGGDAGGGGSASALPAEGGLVLVALAMMTGLGATLLPLWRIGRLELNEIVKEGAQALGEPPRLRRLRGALVVAEAALAVLLLAGAGLFVRTFQHLQEVRRGFETTQRVMVRILSTPTMTLKRAERLERYERVAEAIARMPGVTSATLASMVVPRSYAYPRKLKLHDGEASFETDNDIDVSAVAPGFLAAAGVPALLGRPLTDTKRGDPAAVVVNAAFARKYFPGRSPLGARVAMTDKEHWEIVGVVGDTLTTRGVLMPRIYYPLWQNGPVFPAEILVLREGLPGVEFEKALRRAVYEEEPGFAVTEIKALDVVVGDEVAMERYVASLLKMLSGFALLLAVVGLFATLAFAVAERRAELAIRLTLGATPQDVARLVLSRGMALAAGGVALGLGGAAGLARFAEALLFGVQPLDPLTYGAVGLSMLAVAVPACWWPARRAARIDPARLLRSE